MNKKFFTLYVAIRFISLVTERVIVFAVPVSIYIDTKNISLSGIAYFAQWLPQVLFLPFLGSLADRKHPNRQFIALDVIRAALSLSIPLLFLKSVFITVGVVGCITLLSGYALVAMEAFLSRFANVQDIPGVQAKMSSGYQGSLIVGPALSAFLLSIAPLDKILVFASLAFLACSIFTATLFQIYPVSQDDREIRPHRLSDAFSGFRTIVRSNELITLVILTICVNFVEGLVVSQLPAIVNIEFGTKADAAGAILSIGAFVSFVTLSASNWATKHWSLRHIGLLSIPFVASGMMALSLAQSMMTLSVAFSLWVTGRSLYTLWMRSRRIVVIPRAEAGRVLGVFLSAILAGAPISGLLVAALGSTSRPMKIVTIGLLITVMIVGIVAVFNFSTLSKQFRRGGGESRS